MQNEDLLPWPTELKEWYDSERIDHKDRSVRITIGT